MKFFLKEEENNEENPLPGLKEGIIEIKQEISPDFIWVRVMNSKFFSLKDADGKSYGVECQSYGEHSDFVGGKSGFESLVLLQKYDRQGKKYWRNFMSITLNATKRYIGEFKQYGNQFVGNQGVYGASPDKCADLFFSFLEKNYSNIGKYSKTIESIIIPKTADASYGYASSGLVNLMKNHTERFYIYTERCPDVIMYMEDLIISVLGDDFFSSKKSLSEMFEESPVSFFDDIPKLLKTKKDELSNFLGTINVFEYFKNKEIRPYIIKNLPFLINFINPENFSELLTLASVKEIFSNVTNVFSLLIKMMSNKSPQTKKLLFQFIDSKFLEIINEFGGKGVGLGKLIKFLKRPKLDVHDDAKLNLNTGNFEIERIDNRGNKTKKVISDDNLIFSNKDLKTLLDNHKDEIKSFFSAPGKNPNIEYMRFFIQHLPEGQSKGQLNSMKDEFIDYYNKKFDDGTSEYPGKMLYDALMNQLRFKLGEKTERKTFDLYSIWKQKSNSEYPFINETLRIQDMAIQDMSDSKYLIYLLKYFYKNLKEKFGKLEYSDEGRPRFINTNRKEVTQALSDFLYITASLSGIGKNEITTWLNKINSNFIKMGEADRDPNKYKIPAPSPGLVDWADKESLYADKTEKLDEVVFKNYIRNKLIEKIEHGKNK